MATETSKIIKVMKVLLACLLTIAIAGGAAIALYVKSIRDNPNKAFANTVNFQAVDDEGVVHTYNQGIISFLIVGIDSNDERERKKQGYRSDVMMICVIDTDKNQASIISVPRDTRARVQVLNSSGNVSKMITTKINASMAYGYGPDKFGYQNTLAAINDLLNSTGVQVNPIQHYIGADMDDFVKIANLMGGVDVELPQNVPGFGSKGETVHLEGEKALAYVRIRSGKGLTGSDTDRTTRQRGFIKAVATKMQQQGAMKTIPQIYNDAINKGCIQTNLTLDQIYAISASMQDINFEEVVFEMVPGYFKTESGASYWFVNKTDFKQMILDLFYNPTQGTPMRTTATTSALNVSEETKTAHTYSKSSKTTSKTTKKTTTKKTTESTKTKDTTEKTESTETKSSSKQTESTKDNGN